MNKILVSVVIPVHNGEKYIKKCVNQILKQTLSQIEVILVENFSEDSSLEICKELSKQDDRVRLFQSFKRGTSFARKLGVQKAKGLYITFSDQDDKYCTRKALELMYNTIVNNKTQICQFGFYKEYFRCIKRRKSKDDRIYSTSELYSDQIKGIIGVPESDFSTVVWDKIYESSLLKSSVENINYGMFFAEDEYLNVSCFFNKKLKSVSTSSLSLYCWQNGTGFSSSDNSGIALLHDYDILKPYVINLLSEFKISEDIIWKYNLETVYCCKSIVCKMIRNNSNYQDISNVTEEILSSKAFLLACDYFKNYNNKKDIWEELNKLVNIKDTKSWIDLCK